MKHQAPSTKHRTQLKLALFTMLPFLLLLAGCENEKFDVPKPTETADNKAHIEYLSGVDVPHIVDAIPSPKGKSISRSSPSSQSLNFRRAVINLRKVVKVKDNEGISNYTFQITMQDAQEDEFYNLVVTEDPMGK